MVLKLNRIAILILWGKYRVFVVPIDKTIKGNSYLNLKLVLQDFQFFYVTLFKIGFGTYRSILTSEGVYMLQNDEKLLTENFECLRLEIRFQIKKL